MTARRIRGGDPPLSACRHRRCGAIRMSPCRLRVHPARFPGLLGEHNPLLSPCRVLAVPCLHFSPAAAEAGVRWRRHPRIRQSPACRCRRLRFTRPHPSGPRPYYCVCRVATSASAFLPVVEKRGRETLYSTSCIATGCAVPSL